MTSTVTLFAVAGGFLIGISATLLLLFNGRIAGICGIFAAAVLPGGSDRAWRWLFLGGLLAGTALWHFASGASVPLERPVPDWLVILAGLLVGIGTQMGNGCTSGHGVCGVARFSPRSLLATALFMGAGVLTVALLRFSTGGVP